MLYYRILIVYYRCPNYMTPSSPLQSPLILSASCIQLAEVVFGSLAGAKPSLDGNCAVLGFTMFLADADGVLATQKGFKMV